MSAIRIGTRGSDLALWQARHVAARLEAAGRSTEIVVLETRGDRIDDIPLQEVEGKGFFTAEIEQALLAGRIDLAVHSHKDLPTAALPGLVIAAIPARGAVEERLLATPDAHDEGGLFLPLARGARVGTSAPRRTEQLAALRPDLELRALRGNVPTRVRRLREGRYDAIVLAAAGLDRLALDLGDLVVTTLPRALAVPAPGQGALALQARERDVDLRAFAARALGDREASATVSAERALLVALGGGCNLPLGVALERGASGRWRAHAFLGADHPRPGDPARWCQATGVDPEAAVRAAGVVLLSGAPTAQGPLAGARIALTGSAGAAAPLAARIATLGARITREVVLAIEDLDASELPGRLARLGRGDALVLTSANAARRLAGLAVAPGVLVAAVGPATAQALASAGFVADVVGTAGARELARGLVLARGARVLFPCGEDARSELEEELAPRGVALERLPLYRTRALADAERDEDAALRLYLSPSAVDASLAFERAHPGAGGVRVALGSATAERLAALGFAHRTVRSTEPGDVLEAIVSALARSVPPAPIPAPPVAAPPVAPPFVTPPLPE